MHQVTTRAVAKLSIPNGRGWVGSGWSLTYRHWSAAVPAPEPPGELEEFAAVARQLEEKLAAAEARLAASDVVVADSDDDS
jgi:hypothetical protein